MNQHHRNLQIDRIARMLWAELVYDGVSLKNGMKRVYARAALFRDLGEEYSLIRGALGYGDFPGLPMFLAADNSRRQWRLAIRVDMTDPVFAEAVAYVTDELADRKEVA